jgi:hypothetical protein
VRATARPIATLSESPPQPGALPPRRGPIGWIVASSLVLGAVAALVLVRFAVAGVREHVITGIALLGLALGWAALALLSTRWTSQPQRWVLVPAAVLAVIGVALLLFEPGASVMTALGWVWPPVLLVPAVRMLRQARRRLVSWTRTWLISRWSHRPEGGQGPFRISRDTAPDLRFPSVGLTGFEPATP